MQFQFYLQAGSGLLEVAGQAAAVAGTVVLLLMLVGMGGYAYKSLRGDGIRWPDDDETDGGGGVQRADDDDEWKYY